MASKRKIAEEEWNKRVRATGALTNLDKLVEGWPIDVREEFFDMETEHAAFIYRCTLRVDAKGGKSVTVCINGINGSSNIGNGPSATPFLRKPARFPPVAHG